MRLPGTRLPTLAGCALAVCLGGTTTAAEVVVLRSTDATTLEPALEALRQSLSEHQLVEVSLAGGPGAGEQALRGAEGRGAILVALGPAAAQLCKDRAPGAPLAYGLVRDPEQMGLVGANMAGVAYEVPIKNQLAAFRMVNPQAVKIGVVHAARAQAQVDAAVAAASILRLSIVARSVASEQDVPDALRDVLEEVDAIWLPADPIIVSDSVRRFVFAEALKKAKPVYAFSAALIPEGALVSNGPSMASVGSLLAELVNRIAGGEAAGEIGERVPAAELVINKRVADQMKIEIPADALRSAARVH